MSAMHWGARLSGARSHWDQAHRQCGDRGCNLMRRMWQQIGGWQGRIQLGNSRYCAPECFENAAHKLFSNVCNSAPVASQTQHRIPLGLLMLSRGQITGWQLRTALDAQRASHPRRIGEWLEKLGFATEQQVTAVLGLQWSCPVLAWRPPRDSSCTQLLPYRLLERFRMLPVQFVAATRIFYVAFCNGVDYTALYAISQMLDCRTEACLISRSTMDAELERIGHEPRAGDLLFESWRDPAAMAHIACAYALKFEAKRVRIVGCGEYIWVRLESSRGFATLLFRHPLTAPRQEDLDPGSASVDLPVESSARAHDGRWNDHLDRGIASQSPAARK